jgi:hypothetical protein
MGDERRYAYLHGFASSPLAAKAVVLAEQFAARGLTLERPDLNQPSFEGLSHEACLGALDAMHRARAKDHEAKWCMIGSSFGGWLAARWAQLHPELVDRLVLLCPGFDLVKRWPVILGGEQMAKWGAEGELYMEDATGVFAPVHYGFYVESLRQPGQPVVPCPTLIIHGTRDEVVPIESSRAYAKEHHLTLVEVDDDHSLAQSVSRIAALTVEFFALDEKAS